MSFTIVLTISCVNNILRCGVKKWTSNHGIFHNRYIFHIFYVVVFDVIQKHPFLFLHPQNTKDLPLPYCSNAKLFYRFCNVPYIRCIVTFSIVVNMPTRLAMVRHHFDRTKVLSAN